jgi:hypothetical protein
MRRRCESAKSQRNVNEKPSLQWQQWAFLTGRHGIGTGVNNIPYFHVKSFYAQPSI